MLSSSSSSSSSAAAAAAAFVIIYFFYSSHQFTSFKDASKVDRLHINYFKVCKQNFLVGHLDF